MKNKLIVLILIFILIGTYLFIPRSIKFFDKVLIPTDRECFGQFWLILTNEKQAKHIGEKYSIILPENDYKKNFLLLCDGVEIKSIQYNVFSKFQWEYDVPRGNEVYSDRYYKHNFVCYRINKVQVKQFGE